MKSVPNELHRLKEKKPRLATGLSRSGSSLVLTTGERVPAHLIAARGLETHEPESADVGVDMATLVDALRGNRNVEIRSRRVGDTVRNSYFRDRNAIFVGDSSRQIRIRIQRFVHAGAAADEQGSTGCQSKTLDTH